MVPPRVSAIPWVARDGTLARRNHPTCRLVTNGCKRQSSCAVRPARVGVRRVASDRSCAASRQPGAMARHGAATSRWMTGLIVPKQRRQHCAERPRGRELHTPPGLPDAGRRHWSMGPVTRVRDVASVAWASLEKCYREKLEKKAYLVLLPTVCMSILPRVRRRRKPR
jgi:hypothetical protein